MNHCYTHSQTHAFGLTPPCQHFDLEHHQPLCFTGAYWKPQLSSSLQHHSKFFIPQTTNFRKWWCDRVAQSAPNLDILLCNNFQDTRSIVIGTTSTPWTPPVVWWALLLPFHHNTHSSWYFPETHTIFKTIFSSTKAARRTGELPFLTPQYQLQHSRESNRELVANLLCGYWAGDK